MAAERPSHSPVDAERPFALDELFYSTTDRKGRIRTGNDVFARVSAHPVEALAGSAHNIIRHPDMPRAVFKLLWDSLEQGRTFAGIVKNMSATGEYYWVVAVILPIPDGYLSIRFKPSSALFPVVRDLYSALRETERRVGESAWREGMRRAGDELGEALTRLGFVDYPAFMHTLLVTELRARRSALDATRRGARQPSRGVAGHVLSDALAGSGHADASLDIVFGHLDTVATTIGELDAKAAYLRDLSRTMQYASMNALLSSCRLQEGGEGLSVVTERLAALSRDSRDVIDAVTRELSNLTGTLKAASFSIAAAKLQVEMTLVFLEELMHRPSGDHHALQRTTDVTVLARSLADTVGTVGETLARANAPLDLLRRLNTTLDAELRRLSSVHVTGKIQAAGVENEEQFRQQLGGIHQHLEQARTELEALADGLVVLRNQRLRALATGARAATDSVTKLRSLAAAAIL